MLALVRPGAPCDEGRSDRRPSLRVGPVLLDRPHYNALMRFVIQGLCAFLVTVLVAAPAFAATVRGLVSDVTGAALPGSRVVLRGVATGQESETDTGADGRFQIEAPSAGTYLVIITRLGFSEAARTVVIDGADASLELAGAARSWRIQRRSERHRRTVRAGDPPDSTARRDRHARLDRTGQHAVHRRCADDRRQHHAGRQRPVRGADPVCAGSIRRGLLVLVDGERLNTARQATDRQGAEVGLISPDAISRMEIVNGAGTLLYGSDALAGTINIITNEPGFSATRVCCTDSTASTAPTRTAPAGPPRSGPRRPTTRFGSRRGWSRTTTTRPATSR